MLCFLGKGLGWDLRVHPAAPAPAASLEKVSSEPAGGTSFLRTSSPWRTSFLRIKKENLQNKSASRPICWQGPMLVWNFFFAFVVLVVASPHPLAVRRIAEQSCNHMKVSANNKMSTEMNHNHTIIHSRPDKCGRVRNSYRR